MFCWHCHDKLLLEWVWDYEERVKYIRIAKPIGEQKLRLCLFQPVKGDLPPEVVRAWEAYNEAREAYDGAQEAYDEAQEACDEAQEACDEAEEAYDEAWEACDEAQEARARAWEACAKARGAYVKAWAACEKAMEKYRVEIEALHAQECPDCPWDGKTIFPEGR